MTDAATEEIIQQHTQAIEDVTLSVASLTQALQSEAKRATESDDLQSERTKSAEEKAASAEEKAAATNAALALKADATDLSTLSETVSALSVKRSLADLAVYEEKDGEVEKTDDALVKKSEVGGIVTARQYTDLWDLENGETVRLYFAWNEIAKIGAWSSIEGWDGVNPPSSLPVYWHGVDSLADVDAPFSKIDYLADGDSPTVTVKATRRSKNALGLALVGDGVSEFANDAGYAKTDELSGAFDTFFAAKLGNGTDSEAIYPNVVDATDVHVSGALDVQSWGSVFITDNESSTLQSCLDKLAKKDDLDRLTQTVSALSAKVDEANAALEEVV